MAGETWKPIPCTHGHYFASSFGRIKSIGREIEKANKATGEVAKAWKRESLLSPHLHHSGYYQVTLRVEGKNKSEFVHRLVAAAWKKGLRLRWCPCGGTGRHITVDHLDSIKTNNSEYNLRVIDNAENARRGHQQKKRNQNPTDGIPPSWLLGFE